MTKLIKDSTKQAGVYKLPEDMIKNIFIGNDIHHFYMSKQSYNNDYKKLIMRVLKVTPIFLWVDDGTSWQAVHIDCFAQLCYVWDDILKNIYNNI